MKIEDIIEAMERHGTYSRGVREGIALLQEHYNWDLSESYYLNKCDSHSDAYYLLTTIMRQPPLTRRNDCDE